MTRRPLSSSPRLRKLPSGSACRTWRRHQHTARHRHLWTSSQIAPPYPRLSCSGVPLQSASCYLKQVCCAATCRRTPPPPRCSRGTYVQLLIRAQFSGVHRAFAGPMAPQANCTRLQWVSNLLERCSSALWRGRHHLFAPLSLAVHIRCPTCLTEPYPTMVGQAFVHVSPPVILCVERVPCMQRLL